MLIIHGTYHWSPKRVAFRNDFCLTCEAPRRAVQLRTFDVLHLFWIPVLPLGFWKRWFCASCGQQPSFNQRTRFGFKVAGLVILILMSFAFWLTPIEPGDEILFWAFRLGAPVAAIATLIHLRRANRDPSYSERLRSIPAASDTVCPFCDVSLVAMPDWSCPGCGVRRV
jgi:hypothetical protein